ALARARAGRRAALRPGDRDPERARVRARDPGGVALEHPQPGSGMSAGYRIRPATPADVPAVVAMVHDLAAYERSPQECTLTAAQLSAALFGPAQALFGHVAV